MLNWHEGMREADLNYATTRDFVPQTSSALETCRRREISSVAAISSEVGSSSSPVINYETGRGSGAGVMPLPGRGCVAGKGSEAGINSGAD